MTEFKVVTAREFAHGFDCENCEASLYPDHVILLTTAHIRRFCSVECLVESHRTHLERLASEAMREVQA